MVSLAALSRKVLTYIVPSKKERTAEQALCRRIMRTIRKTRGPHKGAVLAGSIARDTHLAGDKDLDIFVYYSPSLKRESFEKHGLKLGHFIFGKNPHEEAYSEHPYVRGNIDGFDVEIVPVFKVGKATEKISAVDRTPFHTSYVKRRLKIYQRNQVRLLKQFFKGIQVYGADTRYQGVPGYLVELLILEYGTFEKALRAMAFWKEGTVIDRENEYGSESEALSLFPGAFLVVVDPTDKIRNVAAALSYNQFARLIMAARSFLNRPRMTFFFGHQEKALPEKELKKRFQTEELIGLHFSYPKGIVEDVVWGQLARLSRRASTGLQQNDFIVRRTFTHTSGGEDCYLFFDVANPILQKSKTRIGPKVVEAGHAEAFLKAHSHPLSGPRIEEGRLVVEETRRFVKAEGALEEIWKGKMIANEKDELASAMSDFKILQETHLTGLARKDDEFARALSAFLKGKEFFL